MMPGHDLADFLDGALQRQIDEAEAIEAENINLRLEVTALRQDLERANRLRRAAVLDADMLQCVVEDAAAMRYSSAQLAREAREALAEMSTAVRAGGRYKSDPVGETGAGRAADQSVPLHRDEVA